MNAPMPWWKALSHLVDKETGWPVKLVALLAILYTIFPLDLVPDVMPMLGLVDDALVLVVGILYVVRAVRRRLDPHRKPPQSSALP